MIWSPTTVATLISQSFFTQFSHQALYRRIYTLGTIVNFQQANVCWVRFRLQYLQFNEKQETEVNSHRSFTLIKNKFRESYRMQISKKVQGKKDSSTWVYRIILFEFSEQPFFRSYYDSYFCRKLAWHSGISIFLWCRFFLQNFADIRSYI